MKHLHTKDFLRETDDVTCKIFSTESTSKLIAVETELYRIYLRHVYDAKFTKFSRLR